MSPATRHTAILVWMVLGFTLVAANVTIDRPKDAEVPTSDVDIQLQSTAVVTEVADRAAFIEAWKRWDTGEHAVSGVLTRRSGDDETEVRYRAARLGDRWTHQIGPSVVLDDDQGRRVCHQDPSDRFLCTTMESAPAGTDTDSTGIGFGTHDTRTDYAGTDSMASANAAGYTVSALDHVAVMRDVVGANPARSGRCWEARLNPDTGAGEPTPDRQWGRRSWFCFDTETGALMLRHTIMDGWTETAVARIVSGEVTELDLAPSPTLAADGAGTRG